MGMRFRSGESASKMNLLIPTGIGPTSRESSSWSCSELERFSLHHDFVDLARQLTKLPIPHRSASIQDLENKFGEFYCLISIVVDQRSTHPFAEAPSTQM